MEKLIKEPLLHFTILGLFIFAYYSFVSDNEESEYSYNIHLDESDLDRIESAYFLSWSKKPDSMTMSRLVDEEVKSKIFAREAKRLDLHHNDEIINRRLVQKFEFLLSDVAEGSNPETTELKAYYDENVDQYKIPKNYSFYHFYFKEKPNPKTIESLQLKTLDKENKINNLNAMSHHDALHISSKQNNLNDDEIARLLGKEFAQIINTFDTIGWIDDTVFSGFGYHLVYISDYQEPKTVPYEEVQSQVLKHWKEEKGRNVKEELYKSLRDRYEVNISD